MRRHPLDPLSLVAGLLFVALSIWLLTGRVTFRAHHLTLVWAIAAVVLGVALIASTRTRHPAPAGEEPQPDGPPRLGEVEPGEGE